MSLLTIIQDTTDRLGIIRPSSVVGSSDPQVRQLLALAQQEGKELSRRHNWTALINEKTFTAALTAAQSGAIPTEELKRHPWLQIEAKLLKPYTAVELLGTVAAVLPPAGRAFMLNGRGQ